MPAGESRELDAVRGLLSGPVAPTVLPDVLQDRHTTTGGLRGNRVDQRVVRAATRRELDADGASPHASLDLREGVLAIVGVDGDVAANAITLALLQHEHLVVPKRGVARRREVDGRRVTPGAKDGRDVHGDSDARPRSKPRRVALPPVLPAALGMEKMSVHLDERLASGQRLARHRGDHSSSRSPTSAELAALSISAIASSSCASEGKS